MAEPQQPKLAPKSSPGAGRRPLGLTDQWHGMPVWAWTGIGVVTLAGAYLFVKRYRASKAAASTSPTTGALPAGFAGYPSGPFSGGGVTPPPGTTPPPVSQPPAKPPKPPSPPVVTSGSGGGTHQYTVADVLALFQQYNKPLDSTQGPTTETVQQRINRILMQLNNGDRTYAQVAQSIHDLPGSGYVPPTQAQGGTIQMGGLTSTQMASVLAMDVPTPTNQAIADANLARTRAGSLALQGK